MIRFEGAGTYGGDIVVRPLMVWSCPLHDSFYEDGEHHYCDCEHCTYEPVFCVYCAKAVWLHAMDDEGNLLYQFKNEPLMHQMLKELYLPSVLEQLNEPLLLTRLFDTR